MSTAVDSDASSVRGDDRAIRNGGGPRNTGVSTSNKQFWLRFLIPAGILAGFMLWTYRSWENSYLGVFDGMDDKVSLYSVWAKSDLLFASDDAIFQPFMGGLSRGCLGSEFWLPLQLFRYFSALTAYVIIEAFVRLVALLGMTLLLRRHVLPRSPDLIIFGASLCFALLPFFPTFGLAVTGLPLLAYAVINLAHSEAPLASWLIVLLFPFFAGLILVGHFLVPLAGAYAVYRWVVTRKLPVALIAAVFALGVGYLLTDYRLVRQLFVKPAGDFHRKEFRFRTNTIFQSLDMAGYNYCRGALHAASVHFPVILATCLFALALGVFVLRQGRVGRPGAPREPSSVSGDANLRRNLTALIAIIVTCALISLNYGLSDWCGLDTTLRALGLNAMLQINFERLHYLHPMLWGLAFALSLDILLRRLGKGTIVVFALVVLQGAAAVRNDYLVRTHDHLTFREFYSSGVFSEIRDWIGRPQEDYRVVSLGMHPAIPLYNGFYTADGYCNLFPLEYKHRFRKVIAAELEKNHRIRLFFDNWGSRCYLFASELDRDCLCTKDRNRQVSRLEIDTAALRDLHVAYILSAVEILNKDELGLKLEKIFERDDSAWRIRLYALSP